MRYEGYRGKDQQELPSLRFFPSGGKHRLRRWKEYKRWEREEFDIPKRHSRSIYSLREISCRYQWNWSLTVKSFNIDSPEECDLIQKRLTQLLRDTYKRFRVRFLIKREFNLERNRHWPHWHIYSPGPLTSKVRKYLHRGALKIIGVKDNKRHALYFRENYTQNDIVACRRYIGKADKRSYKGADPINTFYPPKDWSKRLRCRAYSIVGLSHGSATVSTNESYEVMSSTRVNDVYKCEP